MADIFFQNKESFSAHELFIILENNILTLMNMVPIDIRNVFTTEKEYDFFQTLEILKGQSLADTYVNFAQIIHDQLDRTREVEQTFLPSIIEMFLNLPSAAGGAVKVPSRATLKNLLNMLKLQHSRTRDQMRGKQ